MLHDLKRILIVSAVFPPEPVVSAQISSDLAKELHNRHYKVTVIAPPPTRPHGFDFSSYGGNYYADIIPGITVINTDSITAPQSNIIRRLIESYSFGKKVAAYITAYADEIDIVYINSWPLLSQFLIAKACRQKKIPYVMHIQDIYPESLTNKLPGILKTITHLIAIPIEKYHLQNASKILAISQNMKNYLAKTRNIQEDKIAVVYNWQNEDNFTNLTDKQRSEKEFTFMYLGNIGPIAGVELLIKAFAKSNLTNSCLVIAGGGSQKANCIKLSESYPGLNVKFIDVPSGDVAKIQNQADVLLLPVIKGGALSSIPSKLPAYMFSKKPVLATVDKESDTAKAIIDSDCGWVGEPGDTEWLADRMKIVSNLDSEELNALGTNGYRYGIANFSKSANLKRLIKEVTFADDDI